MREKLLHPATIIALCALLVAIGGSGYAISQLPRNSVGTAQIKKNAVTSAKVKDGSLLARDFKAGQLPRGERGAQGERGPTGAVGPAEGPAGGALAGTYPNPRLAADALGTSRAFSAYGRCMPLSTIGLGGNPILVDYTLNFGLYLSNASSFAPMVCPLGIPSGASPTKLQVRYRNNTGTVMAVQVSCPNLRDPTTAFVDASALVTTPASASATLRTLEVPIDQACSSEGDMYMSVLGANTGDRTVAAYRVYYSLPG